MLSNCLWLQQADAEHQTSPQQQKLPGFARSCRPICTQARHQKTCCQRPWQKQCCVPNSTTPSGCTPVGELYILPECAPVLNVFVGFGGQVTSKPLLQQATRVLHGHEPVSCLPCMPQSHAGRISRAPDCLNFLHTRQDVHFSS